MTNNNDPIIKELLNDPRIFTRREEFLKFLLRYNPKPVQAKDAFKRHLGNIRVFRALCLVEGTEDYSRIFKQGILLSKCAAQNSLEASLEKAKRIKMMQGIHARLHNGNYEDSDFVFSVADFPEPQIVPAADFLDNGNKAYLLEFDMPLFDALPITIANIAGSRKKPILFYHNQVLFNASDPRVERFVLHKTHITRLESTVFNSAQEIADFAADYNAKMHEQYRELLQRRGKFI